MKFTHRPSRSPHFTLIFRCFDKINVLHDSQLILSPFCVYTLPHSFYISDPPFHTEICSSMLHHFGTEPPSRAQRQKTYISSVSSYLNPCQRTKSMYITWEYFLLQQHVFNLHTLLVWTERNNSGKRHLHENTLCYKSHLAGLMSKESSEISIHVHVYNCLFIIFGMES